MMTGIQVLYKRSESTKSSTAEEAVKATKEGIENLNKLKEPNATEVIANVKFGKIANPFEMKVGASPPILFKNPKANEVSSESVNYLAKMAIVEASFISKDKEVCIESASFKSGSQFGPKFALTYQLASYCKIKEVDLESKCIKMPPSSQIDFVIPTYDECSKIADTAKLADCYCNAISNHSSESSNPSPTSSSGSNSTSPPNSGALQAANSPLGMILAIIFVFSLLFNKSH